MLTDEQKFEVLRILCYPVGTLDPTSFNFSNIVKRQLDAVTGPEQTEVEKLLEKIRKADDALEEMIYTERVKRIDDIEFFEDQGSDLRRARSRYVDELCSLVDLRSRCRRPGMGSVVV